MGIPVSAFGAAAVEELHATVKELGDTSTKQGRCMIRLTWAMIFLGVAMLVTTIAQVGIAVGWISSQ